MPAKRRDQALQTLRLASRWRLPADQWDEVAEVLARLLDALRTGDLAAFGEAAANLMFLGPNRNVSDVDGPVGEPAPPKIRERLNTLIHILSEPSLDLASPPGGHADPETRR
ncbi:hypothetical protein BCD49_32105 [Pseudofrankia sp. EUN1h]|nr:hypothetical protein BCD49_32105 [Pseudofrankia sp. EUN1h]